MARRIPSVREKIEREIGKLEAEFEENSISRTKGIPYWTALPAKGIDRQELLRLVERYVHLGKYYSRLVVI